MNMKTSFLSVLLFTLAGFSVGSDDLSEIQIHPLVVGAKPVGGTCLLTCLYTPEVVENVRWFDPSGNEIVNSEKRRIETEVGQLFLTLDDISSGDGGLYKCEGFSSAANATVGLTREVVVFEPLMIVDTPAVQEFQIGATVSVVCKVTGQPEPNTVFWLQGEDRIDTSLDEKFSTESGTTNLVIANISKEDEGTFTCKARETSQGQSIDEDIEVKVLIPPEITNFVTEKTALEGESAELLCGATGDPQPEHRWYRGDGSVLDETTFVANGTALILEDLTKDANEGFYTCVASNKIASDTATLKLTVYVKPSFTVAEGDTTVEGSEAVLRCVAEGDPLPQVMFYRDGNLLETTVYAPISDDDDYFGNETTNTTMGTWSTNREIIYNGNEAIINFTYTTYRDAGTYECRAEGIAGMETETVSLVVKYAPQDKELNNVWVCPNMPATLECYFDANPEANLTWGQMLPLEGVDGENSTFSAFNMSDPPTGFTIEDVNGILTLMVDTTVAPDGFGKYYCMAENVIGTNNAPAEIFRAGAPDPPLDVEASDIGTRQVTISFTPPILPLVKIDFYVIRLFPTNSSLETEETNIDGSLNEYTFEELEHDTEYTVVIESQNCADTSIPSDLVKFSTLAIETPEPVDVISGKASEEHDKYMVEWTVNGLGGGEISKISIIVRKESDEIDTNTTTYTDVDTIDISPGDEAFQRGSYTIEDLEPSSRYEISVNVHNEVGSAETKHLFMTAARPVMADSPTSDNDVIKFSSPFYDITMGPDTTVASGNTNKQSELAAGSIDVTLIIIIIVVLILLLIIIDVVCFFTRSWGCTMWIYTHTCGKTKKKKVKDAEEGSAEFSSKLTPICEQTPLRSEENRATAPVSGENGAPEGASTSASAEPVDAQEKVTHSQPSEEDSLVKSSNQNEEKEA